MRGQQVPLGGLTGIVGIAVWLAVGLWEMRRRPAVTPATLT